MLLKNKPKTIGVVVDNIDYYVGEKYRATEQDFAGTLNVT
jgi:hypothetical protein